MPTELYGDPYIFIGLVYTTTSTVADTIVVPGERNILIIPLDNCGVGDFERSSSYSSCRNEDGKRLEGLEETHCYESQR